MYILKLKTHTHTHKYFLPLTHLYLYLFLLLIFEQIYFTLDRLHLKPTVFRLVLLRSWSTIMALDCQSKQTAKVATATAGAATVEGSKEQNTKFNLSSSQCSSQFSQVNPTQTLSRNMENLSDNNFWRHPLLHLLLLLNL